MREAEERLKRAEAVVNEAAKDLHEYLSAAEAADARLEQALSAVSELTALISGITN
jgi:RNA 3'-terminal phosphate cyclase